MSARTSTTSPGSRRMEKRPSSTAGETFSITTFCGSGKGTRVFVAFFAGFAAGFFASFPAFAVVSFAMAEILF